MVAETHAIQASCRVLDVAESSFYANRSGVPSARSVRHAWLTDLIVAAHTASRGTYGARRVHAELTLGLGSERRPQRRRDAHAASRSQGPARQQAPQVEAPDTDR